MELTRQKIRDLIAWAARTTGAAPKRDPWAEERHHAPAAYDQSPYPAPRGYVTPRPAAPEGYMALTDFPYLVPYVAPCNGPYGQCQDSGEDDRS